MTAFDASVYKKFVSDYEAEWKLLDSTLYRLCRENPDHTPASMHAKLFIIGRGYATGIERLVPKKDTEFADKPGGSLLRVADHLCANRTKLDGIFSRLRAHLAQPGLLPDVQTLSTFAELHRSFVELLSQITTKGRSPRSFASKYMHFHNDAVPIYDNVAPYNLQRLEFEGPSKHAEIAKPPEHADKDYFDYAIRFFELYKLIKSKNLPLKVKYVDHYLHSL